MGRRILRTILIILGSLLVLIVAAVSVMAVMPTPTDPFIADDVAGTGSVAVQPAYSGLLREFPAENAPADNPTSAAKVELGRQLFFDPLLSANNAQSCATCHHPDLGFSNGQPVTEGRTSRNVPTLWNVVYSQALHWDGSQNSLEAQALIPLTHAREMAADLDAALVELARIPAYVDLFAAAYGDAGITQATLTGALAAFQRSLITNRSPFDQYAAGNFNALTPQQRRGLALFRSGATRCFECHAAPTFGSDTFRVIGVPSDDPGRAGVSESGAQGAFKSPTLRNIALSAPYMHNGSLATLEDVVQFYADGGGRAHGITSGIDPFVAGFELSAQEKADLVAFLHALTDESALPEIPAVALSGQPTVARLGNLGRLAAEAANASAAGGRALPPREARLLTIRPGEDAQAVIDRARPGDTIRIAPGTYTGRIAIDISDITLLGIPNAAGEYPIFDGQGQHPEAIIASGNNFRAGQLHIRNYTDNGILVEGAEGVHLHDLITENTGVYGVYPTKSTDVLVERVRASGVNDAAIYAGQCRNVVVRDSIVFDSVIGIELENTINGVAYNNHAYNNSLGIFVVVLPQLNAKVSRDSEIYDNLIENNNHPNFADEGMAAALVPPGVGILSLGGDNVVIRNNTIKNHRTTGVAVFSLTAAYDANEIDVGPNPEFNHVYGNTYENNAYDPVEFVANLGIPVGDILWDGSGWGNVFDDETDNRGFPLIFPRSEWATALKKIHWQTLRLIVAIAG